MERAAAGLHVRSLPMLTGVSNMEIIWAWKTSPDRAPPGKLPDAVSETPDGAAAGNFAKTGLITAAKQRRDDCREPVSAHQMTLRHEAQKA